MSIHNSDSIDPELLNFLLENSKKKKRRDDMYDEDWGLHKTFIDDEHMSFAQELHSSMVFETMVHKRFPSDEHLMNFFEYVKILSPSIPKRFEYYAGHEKWLVFYLLPKDMICIRKSNPNRTETIYGICLKTNLKKKDRSNLMQDFEYKTNVEHSHDLLDEGEYPKHWNYDIDTMDITTDEDEERLMYFKGGKPHPRGLPLEFAQHIFDIYETMSRYIFAQKGNEILETNGVLHVALRFLIERKLPNVDVVIKQKKNDGSSGLKITHSVNYDLNANNLLISESKLWESSYTEIEIIDSIENDFKFNFLNCNKIIFDDFFFNRINDFYFSITRFP